MFTKFLLVPFQPLLDAGWTLIAQQMAEAEAKRLEFLKSLFHNVYWRDGGHCWLCGCKVPYRVDSPYDRRRGTLDHVIPVSKGGEDKLSNLRLAHRHCNNIRGNYSPKVGWKLAKSFARKLDPTLNAYKYAPARNIGQTALDAMAA